MNNAIWFVAMPFDPKFDPVYEAIAEVAHTNGIECVRGDKRNDLGLVTQSIVLDMLVADLVVVDISSFNPNVFYELGIAHFLGKPTVILSQELKKKKQIPFDIQNMFAVPYDLPRTSTDARSAALKGELRRFVGEKRDQGNPVSAALNAERIFAANCFRFPFLWGYAATLQQSSLASVAWVVSQHLYWERLDSYFYQKILEERILSGRRKELVLMPDSDENRHGTEATIKKFKLVNPNFDSYLQIMLVRDHRPFAFLPTEISIYDPFTPETRAVMLEPMAAVGADRENDERIAEAYRSGTRRQQIHSNLKEATFDVVLSKTIANRIAASFKTIWNELCDEQDRKNWKI